VIDERLGENRSRGVAGAEEEDVVHSA
jgi:hypothetical protein